MKSYPRSSGTISSRLSSGTRLAFEALKVGIRRPPAGGGQASFQGEERLLDQQVREAGGRETGKDPNDGNRPIDFRMHVFLPG